MSDNTDGVEGCPVKRREFISNTPTEEIAMKKPSNSSAQLSSKGPFWPDGARMVISMSMQMEAGAQPAGGAESPMPKIDPRYPDLPASKWYDYGYKEGLPRLLEMFERRKVKVTAHMVGAQQERGRLVSTPSGCAARRTRLRYCNHWVSSITLMTSAAMSPS
jgi:hypothetical protein